MKSITLIRGISGSGKSTFAEFISDGKYDIFSADDYFMVDGEYKFDPSRLKLAHEDCKNKVEDAMKRNEYSIFVANTFTRKWEMDGYFELAEKYNYRIFTVIVENRHGNKNVHNVPETSINGMRERFEIEL